ncbi:PaaI family thioesterase, partial [Litorivivens sp.]
MSQELTVPEGWKRREMKGIPASMEALCTRKTEQGFQYALQVDERHANAQGMLHGGVLMSFLDHGMSLIIWEATDRAFCSTVHLDSHFLAAVRP